MASSNFLQDPDNLFVILVSVIKKNGGKLVLKDEDILKVSKNDLVMMKYDTANNSVVFQITADKADEEVNSFTFGKKDLKFDN